MKGNPLLFVEGTSFMLTADPPTEWRHSPPCLFLPLFSVNACNSSSTRVNPLMAAKWIYLHDFLTFTDEKYTRDMFVMHQGKQNVSNALNSTNIFAVCHAGWIWSMIKGELRVIGTVFEILPCARFLDMNLNDQPNILFLQYWRY